MTIHKEGHKFLIFSFIILAAINAAIHFIFPEVSAWHYLLLTASIIVYLVLLQFFRSPRVFTPVDPKKIIAPADGKVVVIEETTEGEYLKDSRIQISIFMSPVNVHVNRNPVSGVVKYFKYHPGKYLVAWHPKSSTENERTTIVYQLKNGLEIVTRQIAGAMARRIKWYINEGDEVVQGQEFGFIKFGSRLDVFIPTDADVKININDITKAGKTVLAELKG